MFAYQIFSVIRSGYRDTISMALSSCVPLLHAASGAATCLRLYIYIHIYIHGRSLVIGSATGLQDETQRAATRSAVNSHDFAACGYSRHRVAGLFSALSTCHLCVVDTILLSGKPDVGRCHQLGSCAERTIDILHMVMIFDGPDHLPILFEVQSLLVSFPPIDMVIQPKDICSTQGSNCGHMI